MTDPKDKHGKTGHEMAMEALAAFEDYVKQLDHYYETKEDADGRWRWRVFFYDETGNSEITVARSTEGFWTEAQAADDCSEWQDENGIDAQLAGGRPW